MVDMKLFIKWWNFLCFGGIGVIWLLGEDFGFLSMKFRGLFFFVLLFLGIFLGILLIE